MYAMRVAGVNWYSIITATSALTVEKIYGENTEQKENIEYGLESRRRPCRGLEGSVPDRVYAQAHSK